jgi:hypothetical protein
MTQASVYYIGQAGLKQTFRLMTMGRYADVSPQPNNQCPRGASARHPNGPLHRP